MVDAQAAHESTLSMTLTALAGANLIYGLGMLEMGVTCDYGKLVMDNEFAGMIKKAITGIPVTPETLAVDVINAVGPAGEFVSHEHTFQNFKKEQSVGKLIDRKRMADWTSMGSKDMWEVSNEFARDLYLNYQPDQLSDSVKKKIRDIVNEAEDHYGVPLSKE